jgi:hypothetical protein
VDNTPGYGSRGQVAVRLRHDDLDCVSVAHVGAQDNLGGTFKRRESQVRPLPWPCFYLICASFSALRCYPSLGQNPPWLASSRRGLL